VTVSKEIERLPKSSVKLSVTIGKEDVRSEYDALLSDYSKTIQIPGFRKGKAPRDVLIRKFGEALKGEALSKIMEKSITEIFQDESLPREDRPLPYSTPEIQGELPVLDLDADLSFSMVYDTVPQISVGKREGLEVEIPDAKVEEEDLNRELELIRERNAIVLDRDDDTPAAAGDVVTVNYSELSDDGEALEGTGREDFVFTLGSGYNIFKFDDEVIGMKKGETRDITKSYPEDFENGELAGKTKRIRVTLTALKEKKLPDLDDDLAQDVDEKFDTLEDLKADVRDRLNKNLKQRLKEITNSALLEKIMEDTPVEVPESMIRIELESRWRNLAQRFGTDWKGMEKLMARTGKDLDTVFGEWRPDVIRALQSRIIVETLIRDLDFEVSDEDLEKEYKTIAKDNNTSVTDIKKLYEEENAKEFLKEELKERKLFELLASKNTIKKGSPKKYLDLIPNNG
jgi:trigger factor